MSNKDGGRAFPKEGGSDGMSLRDYFAAQALPVLLRREIEFNRFRSTEVAQSAYKMAAAMVFESKRLEKSDA